MNNQNLISDPLIVGCWQLDDRSWAAISELEIERGLDTYLALGISSFDTADIYGRSEKTLGRLLQGRDCTILTKAVFFSGVPTANQIRGRVESSLRKLQREVLDCVQIHWQNPQLDFAETLSSFAQLQEEGKIRYLGVTNFDTPMLTRALEYMPIATHQVQYSLIDRRIENTMQPLCVKQGIKILPYGPLAGGFLSQKFLGVPNPKPEGDHARGFYYSHMIQNHGGWSAVQELLLTLAQLGNKYQRSISQVALNWLKQQPGVGAIISGFTLNRQQIQSNLAAVETDFLGREDLELLSQRSQNLLQQPGDIYSYERG